MYRLNIIIMATVLLIFIFLGATNYLYLRSETLINPQKAHSEPWHQ